jgi:hypothetical protein
MIYRSLNPSDARKSTALRSVETPGGAALKIMDFGLAKVLDREPVSLRR